SPRRGGGWCRRSPSSLMRTTRPSSATSTIASESFSPPCCKTSSAETAGSNCQSSNNVPHGESMTPEHTTVMQSCTDGALSGILNFPQIVGKLMAIGVERYHADYSRQEI